MQTLPQTTPKQRDHLYEDVEALVSPGFLTNIVTIGDQRIVLRSLGPGDLFMLQMRAGLNASEWKQWSVAASIWMVDGHSLLGFDWAVPRFAQMLKRMPPYVMNVLFSQVLGLFARIRQAMRGVEPYMYEHTSRYSWKTSGPDPRVNNGVPGAEKLGLNHVQRMWIAFNETEDRRIAQEAMWEGYKLTAMGTAPKGVKKLDEGDTLRREEEDGRRQFIQDRYYYWRAGTIPESVFDEESTDLKGGQTLNGSKSVDDLEGEMQQWVSGEKDDHDLIVAQYKQRITDQMRVEEEARRRRVLALKAKRAEIEETGMGGPTQLVAFTPDQLAEMLAQRGQSGQPGARHIGPERNAQRYLYDRYLEAEETSAGLQVVDGRLVHPQADPNTDARTLDQIVKGRQVKMAGGD